MPYFITFSLAQWQNFYMLMGAAGATLLGLLFLAFSIGSDLPATQSRAAMTTYVTPTLLDYLQVVVIAALAVMPGQTATSFAVAIALLALLNIVLVARVGWRMRVVHAEGSFFSGHWIWHVWLPMGVGILLGSIAYGFWERRYAAYYGLGIATLGLLLIGVRNTWDLVTWLSLRHKDPEA